MKKLGSTILLVLLAGVMTVTTVFAAPSVNSLKEEKSKVQREMENLQKELNSLTKKIDNLESELIEKGAAVIRATEDLEVAEKKEQEQYEKMKHRIVAMYENGDSSMMGVIFGAKSIGEMLRQAENVQIIHDYDRKQLEEYVETKRKIEDLKTSLESDMATIEKSQTTFEKKKTELNKLIANKKNDIAKYNLKIQQASGNSYTPPAGAGGGSDIVRAAYKYLNVPYKWGGTSSKGVDCSGLTQLAHKAVGISLPRTSSAQGRGGKAVKNMASALPGDLVCYSGHVGIYIGNGQMIHAPHTGDVVRVAKVYGSPWFRRYW